MDSSLSLLLFQDGEDDDGCVEDVVDVISLAVAMPDVSQPAVTTETDGKKGSRSCIFSWPFAFAR